MTNCVIKIANKILGAKFPIAPHPPLLHAAYYFQTAGTAVAVIQNAIKEHSHITKVIFGRHRYRVSIRPDRALVIHHIGAALQAPCLAIEIATIAFFRTRHTDESTRL